MSVTVDRREQKRLSFSGVEVKADIAERTISAYAATWDVDVLGDRIQKGAFRKTLQERGPNAINGRSKIKVLWQHRDPIGVPIRMEEDERGLLVTFKVAPTRLGDEALILASMGVVDSMSIGFDVVQFDMTEAEGKLLRILKELRLFEVSLVTFPANEQAQVLSVKDLSENDLGAIVEKVAEVVEARLRAKTSDPAPETPPEVQDPPPAPAPPTGPLTAPEVVLNLPEDFPATLDPLVAEIKAGRVLSARNRKLVEDAIAALQALRDAASKEEPGETTSPTPPAPEPPPQTVPDPDPEAIQSAVRKAFEGRFLRLAS